MNSSTPRLLGRSYFYLFFAIICLVVLIPGTTIISSSHSLTSAEETGPNPLLSIIDTSYRNDSSSAWRNINQLLLQNSESKVSPRVLADTADGKSASVVILLADQADVSAAYAMKDQDARGWFVYNTLTQHAARTQAGLQAFLTAQGVSYQSFWAANMIVATADRSLVESLAARADVARIDSNTPTRWIEDPVIAKIWRCSQ